MVVPGLAPSAGFDSPLGAGCGGRRRAGMVGPVRARGKEAIVSDSVDFVRDAIVEAAKRVCGGDASVKALGNARHCEISVLGDGMTVIASVQLLRSSGEVVGAFGYTVKPGGGVDEVDLAARNRVVKALSKAPGVSVEVRKDPDFGLPPDVVVREE